MPGVAEVSSTRVWTCFCYHIHCGYNRWQVFAGPWGNWRLHKVKLIMHSYSALLTPIFGCFGRKKEYTFRCCIPRCFSTNSR